MSRSIAVTACSALLTMSAHTAEAGADAQAKTGAAWPKGQYAALDRAPDWGGVWVLNRSRPAAGAPLPEQPRLKGEYLDRYLAWQKQVRENNGVVRRETSNCMPPGMPGMMGTGQYPIEFLFTPGRVTVLHEAWMQARTIFIDGREVPADLESGIFGFSRGRWEGDALVVETIGIKTITDLGPGMKHSDQLQITERFSLDPMDSNTLLLEMTMRDSQALESPYQRRHTYKRERNWNLIEFVCAENDRNPLDDQGYTTFK
jgi:hypothetical protein